MNKEDLYYIYRVQYVNLLNDLDNFYFDLDKIKISKNAIRRHLNKIYRDSYDKTYLLKNSFENEKRNEEKD